MLCYRDMTFCDYYDKCYKGEECFRALTPAVWAKSREHELEVSHFASPPECFKLKEEE